MNNDTNTQGPKPMHNIIIHTKTCTGQWAWPKLRVTFSQYTPCATANAYLSDQSLVLNYEVCHPSLHSSVHYSLSTKTGMVIPQQKKKIVALMVTYWSSEVLSLSLLKANFSLLQFKKINPSCSIRCHKPSNLPQYASNWIILQVTVITAAL